MSVSVQRLVVMAAALVLAVFAYNTLAGPHPRAVAAPSPKPDMPSFLRFDGEGGVAIRPDRATIHFTTTADAGTLVDATNQAGKTMRAVIAAMHAGGVARINMVTDGANGYQTSTGYQADQNLTVTVMKVGTTGKLTAAGLTAGATANYGPDFSSGAKHAGQSQAIRSAVADARSKADAAAAAAGLHVTGVISVSEAHVAYGYPTYMGDTAAKAIAPRALEVPIRRGSQRVTANVTVVFSYATGAATG